MQVQVQPKYTNMVYLVQQSSATDGHADADA